MGSYYEITDRFEEWDTLDDPDKFQTDSTIEDDMAATYPELVDAFRETLTAYPRAAHALHEFSDAGLPDQFIGSDPTEIQVNTDAVMDEFLRHKWVAGARVSQLTYALAQSLMEVVCDWDTDQRRAFYTDVLDDAESDWDSFDEFQAMVEEFDDSRGVINAVMGSMADQTVYDRRPKVGETWTVYAPLLDRAVDLPDYQGASDLTSDVFNDLYRKGFVAQDAEVLGFTPWWGDKGIDDEMTALAHPRMRVKLLDIGEQVVVGPENTIRRVPDHDIDGIVDVPSVEDRSNRFYTGGVLPKRGEEWLVSLPSDYDQYAGGVPDDHRETVSTYVPEEAGRDQTLQATVIRNVDWKQLDRNTDNPLIADKLYHPWMAVELEDGAQVVVPPNVFVSRV